MTDRLRAHFLHLPDGVMAAVLSHLEATLDWAPVETHAFVQEVRKRLEMSRAAREALPAPLPVDAPVDPRETISIALDDLLTALRVYGDEAGLDLDNYLPALDRLREELA